MSKVFDHKTVGMSIDNCVDLLNFDKPNYVKIDVDGIEHLILKGASKTLKNVESVLVEVNDNYKIPHGWDGLAADRIINILKQII